MFREKQLITYLRGMPASDAPSVIAQGSPLSRKVVKMALSLNSYFLGIRGI